MVRWAAVLRGTSSPRSPLTRATELGFTNAAIPSAAAYGLTSQVVMPFWDDVNTLGGTVGNIYWQEFQCRLVVQWEATATRPAAPRPRPS